MKFYSEKLKRIFDTEEECLAEEQKATFKKEAEKKRLEEVQNLEKEYCAKLSSFIEDYGYYSSKLVTDNTNEIMNAFFKFIH